MTLRIVAACGSDNSAEDDGNVVNVYNWADYIAPGIIEQFEDETGIKVNYDVYDSSEVVDVKLLAGNSGYDVVVHSNQFSSRLAPIGIFGLMAKTTASSGFDGDSIQTRSACRRARHQPPVSSTATTVCGRPP